MLVVDASVAVKWLLPEEHSDVAERLLNGNSPLLAPELIYAEAGNAFRKRVDRDQLTRQSAEDCVAAFARLPLISHRHRELLPIAFGLSLACGCSIYDALYLSLAQTRDTFVVTADRPLLQRVTASGMSARVVWIGDIA